MKRLIPIIVISIVLVAILFLWNESLSIHKKINAEKINAFSTSLAVIITSLTVYLLFKQNQQQAEAIKAANQPDLFPVGGKYRTKDSNASRFSITALTEPNTLIKPKNIVYSSFAKLISEGIKDEDLKYSHATIDIHNIGLGTAKEIKTTWVFDAEEIKALIAEKYPDYHIGNEYRNTKFDFLPATSILQVRVPDDYMACCGKEVNKKGLLTIKEECKKPTLKLQIQFYDIYNHEYNKEFDCFTFGNWQGVEMTFQQTTRERINLS